MHINTLSKSAQTCIVIALIIIGLIYGKSLLLPLVFAMIFWVLIRKLKSTINKISLFRKYVPDWAKNMSLTIVIVGVIYFVSSVISLNIETLINGYDMYEKNVQTVLDSINTAFGMDIKANILNEQDISATISGLVETVASSLTNMVSNVFMILLYMLFIFLEESNFNEKLKLIFVENGKYQDISSTLIELENSVSNYLGVKTLVSLITASLSAIALLSIGVDAPIFWALIIFILNYIPTIGSLIATLFPTIFCLFQFGEVTPALLTLIVVGSIQLIIGNVLEPKLVGNSMNISALVAIIALSFWGLIWGTTGMILSVPITVIMVIVFSKFDKTRAIAILLSDKGNV
ncbi:AI-2E family transporter [Flagellimonas pacifica]|uniref:Predicted PurR-regulated permease PerM n=1 Tax=Flagellimonas pacifica TaxID=1247520 RepID=A0A285N087_9FLAO|nr:AI-2E family transporter [Allomuricauda parva]SNZ01171.1 Predicted PurR-regulated permease PerM [Allomuricauda parva]